MEFVYFLGRFHVLALHLPIGILLLAVVFEFLSRFRPFEKLRPALPAVWLAGAVSAVITVALGYMHLTEGGFTGDSVSRHKLFGTMLAVVSVIAAVTSNWFRPLHQRFWAVPSVIVALLLFVVGHYGGNITHGSTYLVEYAPAPIRKLAGLSEEAAPRPEVETVAEADIYLDVVRPALQQRCASCHNADKQRGGFSLASHEAIMAGGSAGPAVLPGDAEGSDLYRRITLPESHDDFMPQDGKTPLNEDEVAAIGWWISAGAPAKGAMKDTQVPDEVRTAIARVLGLSDDGTSADALAEVSPAPPEAIARLEELGFIVRPIHQDSNLLDVDFSSANRDIAEEDLLALKAVAPQMYNLNLRQSGVRDEGLAALSGMANLNHLRLEYNPISDQGLSAMVGLDKLKALSLIGTNISDDAISSLEDLESLESLYVWGTDMSPQTAEAFMLAKPQLVVVSATHLE